MMRPRQQTRQTIHVSRRASTSGWATWEDWTTSVNEDGREATRYSERSLRSDVRRAVGRTARAGASAEAHRPLGKIRADSDFGKGACADRASRRHRQLLL